MLSNNNQEIRRNAFEEFKKIVSCETPNGAETLALFRVVPQFSTAPKAETDSMTVLFRYWSRKGDQEALMQYGAELYHWARDNGYSRSMP